MNGEERAYVVTGQYEKIFPMDIYPQQLIKATIFNDIELMEKLGIYEVAEEDFALCEFSCTSKIPIQKIIRDGLNKLQKEFN
jgi:Na+-transporting NADH:ubiquinone oxidoreductase subunit A